MYFYVDESGHTGGNLFDSNQKILYYGVLSCRVDVDRHAASKLASIRRAAGVSRVHAAELGVDKLSKLAGEFLSIHRALGLGFDVYRVNKPDHAIICFFDQVFDQGMNPAMTWSGYWTPLRFVLLLKVASLFDEGLARLAWEARIQLNDARACEGLVSVCKELEGRAATLSDARSRELIGSALKWAAQNPEKLHYNAKAKVDQLAVMPNVVGFQFVLAGIASRLKKSRCRATRIVVDQQTQFNRSQKALHDFYVAASGVKFEWATGLPEPDFSGMPKTALSFTDGRMSCGLEIVDVYLWIFRRILEGKSSSDALRRLIRPQIRRGRTDEMSLGAIGDRWSKWFAALPEPTPEQIQRGKDLMALDESRRTKVERDST
jgi:hypothetical protein